MNAKNLGLWKPWVADISEKIICEEEMGVSNGIS